MCSVFINVVVQSVRDVLTKTNSYYDSGEQVRQLICQIYDCFLCFRCYQLFVLINFVEYYVTHDFSHSFQAVFVKSVSAYFAL